MIKQIVLVIFFGLYLSVLFFTSFSLVGFWTDIIFSVFFTVFLLRIVYKKGTGRSWLTILLKVVAAVYAAVVFGMIALNFTNPFVFDIFKLRSFYYQKVDGRIFHAYFKPVGAYSGGQGSFWITESPVFFPLIENRVYYERAVHHDFNDDTWEGEPIDNYAVVRNYIKDEVIDKRK